MVAIAPQARAAPRARIGAAQGMRHEMGRGMMRDALVESFQAIRSRLGG